ncbi:unnamed protein product [Medioppia subpectinata]|uniref:alpha-1,2-Mannosidase n=1 Tax=Medioppia subpectinata TaxID=1979941 RepID=A0A7R9KF45_9ACAR|nr:unnamed protein product [Medioppia subpectinata]CAG2102386.1 unnamed protein product [Medioppia subpectinata]
MSGNESLLPTYYQKPFPFAKLLKKYVPLIAISILLTLSLLCYVFMPQIQSSTDFVQRNWPSILTDDTTDPSSPSTTTKARVYKNEGIKSIITGDASDGKESAGDVVTSGVKAVPLPSGDDPDPKVRERRDFVKDMMRHSWDNYVKYAWGHNELKPVSHTGHTSDIFGGDSKLGATVVDSLSTLYIMNMTDEFRTARDWVATSFDMSAVNADVSVFETVIRFVGGLLSAYGLTNDAVFLQKAVEVADHMLPAYNTQTGLPLALVNPKTGKAKNYGWASGGCSILSELGSQHLEFVYLSAATGDPKYADKVTKVRQFMDQMVKPHDGLYLNYVNPLTGQWGGEDQVSMGALGDSFYEYLIKSWVQTNGTDKLALKMYNEAIAAVDKQLVQKSAQKGLTYLAKLSYGHLEHKMEHLACFTGGMFGLGALHASDRRTKDHFMALAAALTDTCAESYGRTATGIGPEAFYFTETAEAIAINQYEKYYILRPEVVESYFYMWRLTHDQRFRDYAWSAAQAINTHCRTDYGFSGIRNTSDVHSAKDDVQQTFFLAETLKYLYLIFSSDDLISLDDWVFNTEAHPLPVLRP